MFDERSTRFPRSPNADLAQFIEEFMRKGSDETGAVQYLDDIVSENRYTNRDFDEMVERVFDAAEFLYAETREFRNVGEAILAACIIYARWQMERDNPREVDDLSRRMYDTLKESAGNYEKIVREMERGGRDDRDRDRDRGRRDDRRDDRDRGRRDDRDRDRGRRDDRDRRDRYEDPREERRREARRDEGRNRGRDRDDDRRERRTDREPEPRKAAAPAKSRTNVSRMSDSARALRLGSWRLDIFKHRQRNGSPLDVPVTEDELNELGIPAEDFVACGGEVASKPTAPENAKPARQEHVTQLRTSSQVDKVDNEVEPVAFSEVYSDDKRADSRVRTTDKAPLTPAEEAALLPQIDPAIDYNRYVTSNDIVYATGQERPKSDPVVPTLAQWARAGWQIDKREFIEQLPVLPAIRGFGEHLPAVYESDKWVPYISPTEDGYKLLSFRERDVNKDDILIPNLGNTRRSGRIANPVTESVNKSTRFNALQVSSEKASAILRHDEALEQWVADGSNPDTAPVPEHINTARNGQMVTIPYTIHATSVGDAIVKMHTALGGMEVGLDEVANIYAPVAIHTLLGVATDEDSFALTKKYLEVFTPDGSGAHLMLPHLWQEFQNARAYIPEHIWLRINILFTDIINEVLANNLCLPTRISSFEAEGRQLLDNLAEEHGRYMAEKLSLNAVEVSKRLRCLSFDMDESVGKVPRAIWAIEKRTVMYANAMLNEFGLSVFDYGGRDATPDRNRVTHYVVRPEQNATICGIVERLNMDADWKDALPTITLVTLDDYSCVLEPNWLSQGTYYTMALSHL